MLESLFPTVICEGHEGHRQLALLLTRRNIAWLDATVIDNPLQSGELDIQ